MLSLLFHDVGKWKDEDHATESVRMADHMMTRLQMPAESREIVDFLIKNHLQMSRVAFHRDTEDPEIVKEFAALVGIEERLKMLCLMTVADIEAVSPDTLTPWKEELLWRLYVDTYNHLTHAYADELIDRHQAGRPELLSNRPADIPEAEIARVPRRASAALPAAGRPRGDLRARPAVAQHRQGRRPRQARAQAIRSGS